MNILACRPFNVVYVPEYLGQGKVMGGHGTQDKEKSQKSTIPLFSPTFVEIFLQTQLKPKSFLS